MSFSWFRCFCHWSHSRLCLSSVYPFFIIGIICYGFITYSCTSRHPNLEESASFVIFINSVLNHYLQVCSPLLLSLSVGFLPQLLISNVLPSTLTILSRSVWIGFRVFFSEICNYRKDFPLSYIGCLDPFVLLLQKLIKTILKLFDFPTIRFCSYLIKIPSLSVVNCDFKPCRIKIKTIHLVFVASLISMQHYGVRTLFRNQHSVCDMSIRGLASVSWYVLQKRIKRTTKNILKSTKNI